MSSPPIRRIAHLDMDAFFASVELLRQPQLKGLPVVVGGSSRSAGWLGNVQLEALPPEQIPLEAFARLHSYTGRGVITTATYEARKFGIGSAMGMMKAAKLCPDAYLLPADFEQYRAYSRRFKAIIAQHAPDIEERGIDEVYIDFTEVSGGQEGGGLALAQRIQQAIYADTGLTCSIGVAPNKLLAKLASEWHKPNGIFVLMPEGVTDKLWPLPCKKVNGIGPKTNEKLESLGIFTLHDLAHTDAQELLDAFGQTYGAWLHRIAWGQDERPLVMESAPVSMSRETTFERDLHARTDKAELSAIFTHLCQRVAADLQRKGYAGRTVGVKIRFPDFRAATRAITLDQHTQNADTIRQVAGQCLKRIDLTRRFRLLGVKVDNLLPLEEAQQVDAKAAQRPKPTDCSSVQLSLPFD